MSEVNTLSKLTYVGHLNMVVYYWFYARSYLYHDFILIVINLTQYYGQPRIKFFSSTKYVYINIILGRPEYSVMQSDGNSFGGDVVSGSFNKTFLDEENILDQIYKSKCFWIILVMILILDITHSAKTQFYEFHVVMCFISYNVHFLISLIEFKIFITTFPIYLLFILLV